MLGLADDRARDEWCRNRRATSISAVFHAGDEMRCPLSRAVASGRRIVCGSRIGLAPDWVRDAVVRGDVCRPPIPNSEHQIRTCPSCHKTLDVFLVRAVRLEATG